MADSWTHTHTLEAPDLRPIIKLPKPTHFENSFGASYFKIQVMKNT